MTEITSSSAAALAGLISSKKASSVEITTAFLDRLEKLNPKTNSYLYFNRENSLAQAKRADQQLADGTAVSPLHGVPIAVKATSLRPMLRPLPVQRSLRGGCLNMMQP